MRSLLPGGEVITVKNLEIKRDAATFTFSSGSIAFYGEVNGKVTGAVFRGQGHLHITPPTAEERHNLKLVAQTEEFDEDFDQVVMRFTDATAAELHKAATGAGQPDNAFVKAGQDVQSFMRHHAEGSNAFQSHTIYYKRLYENLDLRLLQDVLSPAPGAFFMAAIHGNQDARLFFIYDTNGIDEVAPEEVALLKWSAVETTETIPLAFHRAAEYANGTASGNEHNAAYTILSEDLDVGIEKNGVLTSVATVEVRANQDGVAVIPFDLYPSLRVSEVETEKGDPLDWVQEKVGDDPDFGLVLAAPLNRGQTAKVKITYGGKDVVLNEGNGNYYPIAREDWYPNSNQGFGDYANYTMHFHVAKGLQLVATGTKVNESSDGRLTLTEWKTDVPLPMVGFNFGQFVMKEVVVPGNSGGGLTVDAYANTQPPSIFSDAALGDNLPHPMAAHASDFSSTGTDPIGKIDTTGMLPVELSQAKTAAQIYIDYFGPIPFPKIAVTQQFACSYGQSWPMLVYLPICGFFDKTQQQVFDLDPSNMYWRVVTPHEVAHQWWGQTVSFRSYRDQWMSEGFAQASAAIFLEITHPKLDDYLLFWKEERRLIIEKNAFGFRPIDVGPVTMGARLSSLKTGWDVYTSLVYPKGAYILHMIRMMMWSPKDGDARFKATMHDFVNTYRLEAATTEDFKAIVEEHMSQGMDLEGNHRMDWFFREYVYGTDLPAYHFEGDATPSNDGWSVHFKLTQSSVGTNFVNSVPIYLELTDGKVIRLGLVAIHGPKTVEQTVQLPKLPAPIREVSINHFYDVLCTDN